MAWRYSAGPACGGAADELFEGGALAFEGRHDRLRNLPVFGRLRRADRVGAVHGPDTDPDTNGGNGRGGRAND